MKFEKTIRYSANVEFESYLEDMSKYVTNKEINKRIRSVVDKTMTKYFESDKVNNTYTTDGIKVTITESFTTIKKSEEYD